MTRLNSPKKTQPRPPTLHLDHHQAWRQSENAIIIPIVYDPIVYDFPGSTRDTTTPDALIIPFALPAPAALFTPPVLNFPDSAALDDEIPSQKPERVLPWPIPEEIPDFLPEPLTDAAFAPVQPHPDILFLVSPNSAFSRVHHLSTAVPLLLLGGIVLVFFAWMAFR